VVGGGAEAFRGSAGLKVSTQRQGISRTARSEMPSREPSRETAAAVATAEVVALQMPYVRTRAPSRCRGAAAWLAEGRRRFAEARA